MMLFEDRKRYGKQYCEILPLLALGAGGLGLGAIGGIFGASAEKKKLALQQQQMQNANRAGEESADYINRTGFDAQKYTKGMTQDAQNYLARAQNQGQAALDPYTKFGESGLNALSQHMGTQPGDYMDPGYDFRLKSGSNAIMGNAAASGLLGSGDTLRALTQYGQDMGSQEYGNAFNRYLQKGQLLQGNVGIGEQAALAKGQLGMQGAGLYGNFGLQGAGLHNAMVSNTGNAMANARLQGAGLSANIANNTDPGGASRVWGNYLGGLGGMAMGAAGTMGAGGGSNIFAGLGNLFGGGQPKTPSYNSNWLGVYGR